MNIANIKTMATTAFGRSGLLLRKYSPEILLGAGIVGVVATTVIACKATTKVEEIRKSNQEALLKIADAKDANPEAYTEDQYKKEISIAYLQGLGRYVKLYAPAATLGIASIGLILASHGILSKRNASIIAAYKILDSTFSRYRNRVIEDLGPEADSYFRYGVKEEKITEKAADLEGNIVETEKTIVSEPPCMLVGAESEYARLFDKNSPEWRKDYTFNLFFLKSQQNHANDLLKAQGHVFLNDVYTMLGLKKSKAGCIVGWVKNGPDGYIDFGLDNPVNQINRADVINGYTDRAFLLDFNVDGVIWDLI